MIATHSSTEMIGRRPDSGDGTLSPCSPARVGQLGFVSHPFNLLLDKLTNTNANSNANTFRKEYKYYSQQDTRSADLSFVFTSSATSIYSVHILSAVSHFQLLTYGEPWGFHVSGQSSLSARPHMSRLSLYCLLYTSPSPRDS